MGPCVRAMARGTCSVSAWVGIVGFRDQRWSPRGLGVGVTLGASRDELTSGLSRWLILEVPPQASVRTGCVLLSRIQTPCPGETAVARMWLLGNEEHQVSPASLRAPGSQVKSLCVGNTGL